MDPFIGQLQAFAFNFTPQGWISCAGQYLSPASYPSLFSLIGTIYGGDGRTTFALPDLRGRVALNQGQGPGLSNHIIGTRSGLEVNYLTTGQMPSHNHAAAGTIHIATAGTNNSPAGAYPAPGSGRVTSGAGAGGNVQVNSWGAPATGSAASDGVSVVVGYNGGNQPVNNMQPFLTVNWCIAVVGIYPSRASMAKSEEEMTEAKLNKLLGFKAATPPKAAEAKKPAAKKKAAAKKK